MKNLSFLFFSVILLFSCAKEEKTMNATNEHVALDTATTTTEKVLVSHLELLNIETGEREEIYASEKHFEAPNWTGDGK